MAAKDWLKNVEMLKALTREDRSILSKFIKEKTYKKGHIFYEEDQEGGNLYFIREGRVQVFRRGPKARRIELAVLKEGYIFGEMAFFDRGEHTACISALEKTIVGVLNIDQFDKMSYKHPSLAYAFTKELFLEFQKHLRRMNNRYLSMMKMMHFLGE